MTGPGITAPPVSLLCKLASIAVHADEFLSADGHSLDEVALTSALNDPEVKEWLSAMADAALAPRKRSA
jgi:hypothetical protein